MCRNFINSLLKVSNGIQFHRKKRGRIYDTESMTLGDQTFEGCLVNNIDLIFLQNHPVEFIH